MGNNASIAIQLDSDQVIQAGSTVRGKVVVAITSPIKSGSKVFLQMFGKEKVDMIGSLDGNLGAAGSKKADRTFFAVNLQLADLHSERNRQKIPAGTYPFPFAMTLPSSLPATTRHPNKGPKGFRIQYKMVASMGDEARDFRTFKTSEYVPVLSAPLPDDPVPITLRPTQYPVKGMGGLLSKGSFLVGASVENVNVGRGCDLHLSLACRNDSTVEIKRVEIKLIELLTWNAVNIKNVLGPSDASHRTSTQVLVTLPDVNVPGISRHPQSKSVVREHHQECGGTAQQAMFRDIYNDLQKGNSSVKIRIPSTARDSYKGQLISIEHFLDIKVITPSTVSNPQLSIPIRIGTPSKSSVPPKPATKITRQVSEPTILQPKVPQLYVPTQTRPDGQPNAFHESLPDIEICVPPNTVYSPDRATCLRSNLEKAVPVAPTVNYPNAPPEALRPAVPQNVIPCGNAPFLNRDSGSDDSDRFDDQHNHHYPLDHGNSATTNLDSFPVASSLFQGMVPLPPPMAPPLSSVKSAGVGIYTLPNFLGEMSSSMNDYDMICRKLKEDGWRQMVENMTPADLGTIISKVNVDSDQLRVATVLSKHVNHGQGCTCAFAAAAIQNTAEWYRTAMAQRLYPCCVDVAVNSHLIEDQLNEWERTVSRHDLQRALQNASGASQVAGH